MGFADCGLWVQLLVPNPISSLCHDVPTTDTAVPASGHHNTNNHHAAKTGHHHGHSCQPLPVLKKARAIIITADLTPFLLPPPLALFSQRFKPSSSMSTVKVSGCQSHLRSALNPYGSDLLPQHPVRVSNAVAMQLPLHVSAQCFHCPQQAPACPATVL
jgi:hypothetical protein